MLEATCFVFNCAACVTGTIYSKPRLVLESNTLKCLMSKQTFATRSCNKQSLILLSEIREFGSGSEWVVDTRSCPYHVKLPPFYSNF